MKPATASCQKQSARHRQSACSNSANVAPTWPMLQRYVDLLSVSHMFLSLALSLSLACSIDPQPNLSRPKTLHTNLFFAQELPIAPRPLLTTLSTSGNRRKSRPSFSLRSKSAQTLSPIYPSQKSLLPKPQNRIRISPKKNKCELQSVCGSSK